ncbi:isochorismatase family protein [Streptomyces sp. NPDC002328]|uniref:isochorismatase family protein n=1 Tax=Streptomyces sp. NPDC002328 TaxID=3364642 RepID=UPI0036BB61E5
MGLPTIAPYPMPDGSALPRSPMAWSIAPERGALLIHGMQNRSVGAFPAGRSPVVELVENITALRELARALGMPVVFSAETVGWTPGDGGLAPEAEDRGPGDAPDAAEIIEPLAPRPGEHVLGNVRHNAFLRSRLGRLLRSEGRDQLIVCGVYAHLGILLTAADASMNGLQPFVVADAVADVSAEEHGTALRWSARGSVVRTTDALLRGLLLHHGRREA